MGRTKPDASLGKLNIEKLITEENKTLEDILKLYMESTGRKMKTSSLNNNITRIYKFRWLRDKWYRADENGKYSIIYHPSTEKLSNGSEDIEATVTVELNDLCENNNEQMAGMDVNTEVDVDDEPKETLENVEDKENDIKDDESNSIIEGNEKEQETGNSPSLYENNTTNNIDSYNKNIIALMNDIRNLMKEIEEALLIINNGYEKFKKIIENDKITELEGLDEDIINKIGSTSLSNTNKESINITTKELIELLSANKETIAINVNKSILNKVERFIEDEYEIKGNISNVIEAAMIYINYLKNNKKSW
jgi:hypothetical protein